MIINRNDYDVQKCAKRGVPYFCIWDITGGKSLGIYLYELRKFESS